MQLPELGNLFKYIFFVLFLFTSLSPCRKDQFAASCFSTSLIVLIQVNNWEIRHHSLVCCCGVDLLIFYIFWNRPRAYNLGQNKMEQKTLRLGRKRLRPNISFPASRMRRTVWKDGQRKQAKAEWISLFCLQISFVLECF